MAEKELNKIVVLEPCTPAVEELLKKVEGANQAELIRLTNPEEAIQSVRQYQPCILVTCTINNADIPVRVNVLKKLESSIKSGVLKTLFVSKLKNRQLGSLITSLGVTDFIEEPVPARTLQFKTNLQLKAVETVKKQQELKKASQEKIVFKKSEAKQENGNAVASESSAKRKPALNLEEDTFLFKNSGVKKVGKKTLVELEGPAPESGEWVPHEDKGDVKTSWRWVPNEKKELAKTADEKEGWVHEGEKPQFNEESGKWQFNSEKPDLSFQKKGEKIASKISTDESGEVVVAEDSPKAEENVKKEKEKLAKKKEERKKEDPRISKEKTEKAEEDQAATLRAINREKKENPSDEIEKTLKKTQEEEPDNKNISKKKTSDLEDRLNRAMNKLGTEIPSTAVEEESTKIEDNTATEDEAPKNPLDFLKKKREQKEKQKIETKVTNEAPAPNEAEVIALKQTPSGDKTTEQKEFKANKEKEEKPKKSATDAAKEALERMKRKMDATKIGSIGEEANPEDEASKAFTENSEDEKEDDQAIQLKANSKERKKKETKLGNDSREKSRETAVKKEIAPRMKPEERKAKKREILSKIQEVLGKPLPDSMSSEEEEKLRKDLGLENKREIPPRELAKRAKLNKVKELKEQLEELNGYVEDSPEFREHDLNKDDLENTWSQKGPGAEKERRKINAYDSDAPEESEVEGEILDSKIDKRSDKKEKRPIEDRYVYLPESEVTPLGGAWESSGEYYIFLAATVRYKGFEKLDDLCPMLFYRGEKIPELLDKTKQWRFLDRLPIRAERAADIPKDIRDFLFSLKAQVQAEEKKKIEEEKKQLLEQEEAKEKSAKKNQDSSDSSSVDSSESKKIKEPSKLSNLLEELENQAREMEEKATSTEEEEAKESKEEDSFQIEKRNSSTEDLSGSLEPTRNKKEEKKSLKDLMASLEKEEAEQKEKYGESESEVESSKLNNSLEEESKESDAKVEDAITTTEEKKADKNKESQLESNLEETADATSSNKGFEEKKEEKASNRSKESSDLESRLAALKSKLDDPFPGEEEKKVEKPETILEESPRVKPEKPLESEGVENVKEKLKAGSEAIEKFLERRKQKKSKTAKELLPAKKDSQKELAQHSPYLSVYLAVSNAFGSSKDPTKSVQRILRSMEDAFGNCVIYIFFDKGPIESGTVEISSNGTGIGQKIPISSGLACPIQFGVGSEEGSFLGYLFLKPSGTREFFTGAEEDAANKVATSLWSILVNRESNEAKAA